MAAKMFINTSSSSVRFTLFFFLMVSLFALHQCRENPNYVTNKNNSEKAAVLDQVQVLDKQLSTGVHGSSSNSTSSTDMKLVICLPSGPSKECFALPDCWCCTTGIFFCYGNKDDCMDNCG